MYHYLPAGLGDLVLAVYRTTRPGKTAPGTSRRYGESGQSEAVQLEAVRTWRSVPPAVANQLKGVVYVVDGTVACIRAVQPNGTWHHDAGGCTGIPLTAPLTSQQAAEQFPTLGLQLGDHRPHMRGNLVEYLPL